LVFSSPEHSHSSVCDVLEFYLCNEVLNGQLTHSPIDLQVQEMNFAFFNGSDWQSLPSFYDGDRLFTNVTVLANGWTSLAITNQAGSNFSTPLVVATSTRASATSTMTRTASRTTRPDAVPDVTTPGSGAAGALKRGAGIVAALIAAMALF
jgi:hypothetical protein